MPVDRAGRDRIAKSLAAYLRGEIDNFALDDAILETYTQDTSLRTIKHALWCCYDDCKRHTALASPQGWCALIRCVAFLKGDLEFPPRPRRLSRRWIGGASSLPAIATSGYYAYLAGSVWQFFLWLAPVGIVLFTADRLADRRHKPAPCFWPFGSEADWLLHKHLADTENIPPYDPAIHGKPIRNGIISGIMCIPGTLMMILVIYPFVAVLHLLPRRP